MTSKPLFPHGFPWFFHHESPRNALKGLSSDSRRRNGSYLAVGGNGEFAPFALKAHNAAQSGAKALLVVNSEDLISPQKSADFSRSSRIFLVFQGLSTIFGRFLPGEAARASESGEFA